MCEFDGKLIAWLDGELPGDVADAIERHIGACAGCQERVNDYKQVNSAFVVYRDALARDRMPPAKSPAAWLAIPVAIAAGLALFLLAPRHPVVHETQRPLAAARVSEMPKPSRDREEAVVKHKAVLRHRPRMPAQNAAWVPDVPMISIAIPADALFAPGAIPDGIDFLADLCIAADGSPRGLRLRP